MTNYTLTQSEIDMLISHSGNEIRKWLRELKPNSQEPVGFLSKNGYLYETLCAVGEGSEPLYTHPAPTSKEDMVKVLEALRLPCDRWNKVQFLKINEAITIMQSAIEGMK